MHIVYMGSPPVEYSTSSLHLSILQEVVEASSAEELLVRSYRRSFNGFAAMLTQKEIEKLTSMKQVLSVFPSRTLQLQTTRSWDFMGFPETVHRDQVSKSDVIIGVIDTGIWPESPSFKDDGFGPPPKKWRGVCKGGSNFTCNNKLIGARSYTDVTSVRDDVGHGTHTASTAAGRKVDDVSFYGLAKGTARGGVPSARISVYKVCNFISCFESNVLAAFDDAIADGVDIITISIGGSSAIEFFNDAIAIGSFHAMSKGILTLQSAGNGGDQAETVGSVAPWLFTVAASSIDRRIVDKVVLKDGRTLIGNSVNSFTLRGDDFPLVYGSNTTSKCGVESARLCLQGCLDRSLVTGKIVVCDDFKGINEAMASGAVGSLAPNIFDDDSVVVPFPAAGLKPDEYQALVSYVKSTRNAKGKILKSEAVNDSAAPVVVSFSSRGPNTIASDILKPDITAPGVDILAGYSPIAPLTAEHEDTRSVMYNIMSGTSMSCPHVAGAAGYVKLLHPDWSPAAIKSAIMTTAKPMSAVKNPDAEFAYGSGHIDPMKAANPGLLFEATEQDYIAFLCEKGLDIKLVRRISGDNSSCPAKLDKSSTPVDLNYPSMAVLVKERNPFSIKFHRTVTNVGVANSTYKAEITSESKQVKFTVEPESLSFDSLGEKKSFNVSVTGANLSSGSMVSASLVWHDGVHSVRSPVVVYTQFFDAS